MDTFRALIEETMRERDWSLSRLAREAGLQPSVVSRWLSEDQPMQPSPRNLERLVPVVGRSKEDLMRMCGYLDGELQDAPSSPKRAEIQARLGRFGDRLETYPRPFWLPVFEAIERMLDAFEATAEISSSPQPPVSRPVPPVARRQPAKRGKLDAYSLALAR